MSSDGNLLQIIFDGIWGTLEIIVSAFTKKEEKRNHWIYFLTKWDFVIKIKNIRQW